MKILCKSNQMDLHHSLSPLYKNKIGDISFQKGYNQNLANLVILECAIQLIPFTNILVFIYKTVLQCDVAVNNYW